MKKFSGMRFDNTKGVRYHIMKMKDITAQLKALKVEYFDSFLVYFILNSLPAEYGLFKIIHNIHKKKWFISKLLTMYIQEEEKLK